MKVLITGAAGFIGSRTAHALLDAGVQCRAVDSLVPYYDVSIKEARLDDLRGRDGFEFHQADLRIVDLDDMLDGVDTVIHLAAQPGVRSSWGEFASYVEHNVVATQRLLEAARDRIDRFVYASSSSVYGEALGYLTTEDQALVPRSPYGATKLSGEHLCGVYTANFGVSTVMLRYFTVFGPGQRPDMAMHRLVEAATRGGIFPMFGSGRQVRDFTHVDDVVRANILAATSDLEPGHAFNVAGGTSASLLEVIETIEELTGQAIAIDRQAAAAGDVKRTSGSTDKIRDMLGWAPEHDLVSGLTDQIAWHERHRELLAPAV